MDLEKLNICPGTLAINYTSYSQTCLRSVFNKKKVSHILPYEQPGLNESVAEMFIENRKRISISGVQEKISLILEKNILRLTKEGEQGTYILKPIPQDVKKTDLVPANEHLTMQIASQVYGLRTASNALIFFKDGTPAYITKRFDVKQDGSKWGIEDFATLAGKTNDIAGPNFKYNFSYEEMGYILQTYVPAWRIEIERFFSLVLFNYLFSNGDAHLKNFSVIETLSGDYILSPAYDLINTRIHVDDADFALDKGLFIDTYRSGKSKITGHAHKTDFIEFAKRIGITESRTEKLILPFLEKQAKVESLISNSFLNEPCKRAYLLHYNTKRNYLTKT